MIRTKVKKYTLFPEYKADAPKMASNGWRVVNVTNYEKRGGFILLLNSILTFVTLGLWLLFKPGTKPEPELVVTYEKTDKVQLVRDVDAQPRL